MGACLGLSCKSSQEVGKPVTGINKKRGCTDFPFLALFCAWWVASVLVLGIALGRGGDPMKLIHKTDYKGTLCSQGDEVDRPLATWLSPNYPKLYVCVASCDDAVRVPFYMNASTQFVKQCLPPPDVVASIGGFGGASENLANAMADVLSSIPMIGAGAGIAIIIAFLYVWFLRMFAGCLVWTAIGGTILGGAFLGWTFLEKGNKLKAEGVQLDQANAALVFAYVSFGATGLFALIILALRKRIKIAVEVVKEASRAIGDLPGALIFPLFTLAAGLLYFVFWIWGTLVIFSVRVESDPITISAPLELQLSFMALRQTLTAPDFIEYKSFMFDPAMQRPFLVFFFHLLWNVQFLIYFTFGVVAGAVADWYFTARDPESGKKIRGSGESELAKGPVYRAFWRIFRYHIGTIAFGSFIIATVQFIRAMVKYIEKQSKTKNNRVQKAIFCAIHCCLWCLECCLDKLSKNAFVWNAIYGDPFCVSAVQSFKLIWANLARVAAINMVSGYLLIIGKVLVAVFTAGIVGFLLMKVEPYMTEVASPIFPSLVVLLLAYMVGSLFMVVYETTIDTIFLCFLVDEVNNASGDMLASKSLQAVIGKYADASAKLAAKEKAAPGEKVEDPKK